MVHITFEEQRNIHQRQLYPFIRPRANVRVLLQTPDGSALRNYKIDIAPDDDRIPGAIKAGIYQSDSEGFIFFKNICEQKILIYYSEAGVRIFHRLLLQPHTLIIRFQKKKV